MAKLNIVSILLSKPDKAFSKRLHDLLHVEVIQVRILVYTSYKYLFTVINYMCSTLYLVCMTLSSSCRLKN